MTKKKSIDLAYTRLELAQYRLRVIANNLERGIELSQVDKSFLVESLWKIGRGEDANIVFSIKAKRGERKTAAQIAKRDKLRMVMAWIAAAIAPENEFGSGMSLDKAIEAAAKHFLYSGQNGENCPTGTVLRGVPLGQENKEH